MTGKYPSDQMTDILPLACIGLTTGHIETVCLRGPWTIVNGTAHDIATEMIKRWPKTYLGPYFDFASHPNLFMRTREIAKRHGVSPDVIRRLLARLTNTELMLVKDKHGGQETIHIFQYGKDLFHCNNSAVGLGGITLVLQSKKDAESITGENANRVFDSTKKKTKTDQQNTHGALRAIEGNSSISEAEKKVKRQEYQEGINGRVVGPQGKLFNERKGA